MAGKIDTYEQLLLELSPHMDQVTQARIRKALEKVRLIMQYGKRF